MLSQPINQILEKYHFTFDNDKSLLTGSFILPQHPAYTLYFECENITSDASLVEALSYEISSFSFEKIGNVYQAEALEMHISELSDDFKELYILLCHMLNEITQNMKGEFTDE